MKKKIVVLGAGLVGQAMAVDLQKKHHTVAVDINQDALKTLTAEYGLETVHADISEEKTLSKIIADCDLVIGSVLWAADTAVCPNKKRYSAYIDTMHGVAPPTAR